MMTHAVRPDFLTATEQRDCTIGYRRLTFRHTTLQFLPAARRRLQTAFARVFVVVQTLARYFFALGVFT